MNNKNVLDKEFKFELGDLVYLGKYCIQQSGFFTIIARAWIEEFDTCWEAYWLHDIYTGEGVAGPRSGKNLTKISVVEHVSNKLQ